MYKRQGLDYRFNGGSFVGLAVGYIDSDNDAFGNLGGTTTNGYSATLYSTWQHNNFFLDASLSAGDLDLDLERVILLPEPLDGQSQLVATGETDSEYVTATVGLGYDFNLKRNGLTGFLRANATEADVRGFTETGAGGFNLVMSDQTAESLLAEAGFEWVRPVSFSWGVFQPVLRLSYFHEFDNDARLVTGRFALDATGSQFVILTEDPDRDFLTAGAGFTLTLKRNKSLFLLYETDLERDDLDVSKISFGARFQF